MPIHHERIAHGLPHFTRAKNFPDILAAHEFCQRPENLVSSGICPRNFAQKRLTSRKLVKS
jgi:hypothetical protein